MNRSGLRHSPGTPAGPADEAFTLVELVVVLLIVMVLAGLLSTAAFTLLARMKKETVKVDFQNLTIALSAFYKDHRAYPPDILDLKDVISRAKTKDTYFFPNGFLPPPLDTGAYNIDGIDNDVKPDRASNELMVFFLGRKLPKKLSTVGPYMDLKKHHIKDTETVGRDGYLEYLDPWGNPYVYIERHSDNVGKLPAARVGHGPFEIYSCGPDGQLDHDYWNEEIEELDEEDDDIATWSE